MKKMNKVLITLVALCISWGVHAHNPDVSSTILVEQNENKWVLQIRAALTAFEYEIENHSGKNAYSSPEEFKELVINHVQKNTAVLFNGTTEVALQNGIVKLGHETTVTFEVMDTPKGIQSLDVKNSSFSDIPRNQSSLIVVKKGFAKDQFILNNNNEHMVKLKVGAGKFEQLTPIQKNNQQSFLKYAAGLLVLTLMLLILYFVFKNRQSVTLVPATSKIYNLK